MILITLVPEVSLVDLIYEDETPSEGETSGNNCLQPHFHAVKFWFLIDQSGPTGNRIIHSFPFPALFPAQAISDSANHIL